MPRAEFKILHLLSVMWKRKRRWTVEGWCCYVVTGAMGINVRPTVYLKLQIRLFRPRHHALAEAPTATCSSKVNME
jgi:hypothetical protein